MRIQQYELIRELGRGGMGSVFLALDTNFNNRQVAIKILDLNNFPGDNQLHQELIYNFKREAISILNINHENIVNVYDIGQFDQNNHYIVMELLEGQSLEKFLAKGPLDIVLALDITIQMCKALGYIHKNNVVHRDIKPENIVLSEKGVAKLTDFGIAKFVEEIPRLDNIGAVVGTILYMSPEQLRTPDSVDGRADMYSLAASLYELLTGQLPLIAEEIAGVIKKIFSELPVPVSQLNPKIPQSLESVIDKAMAKNKEDRYSDMNEFASALKNLPEYKDALFTKFGHEYFGEQSKSKLRKKSEDHSKADLDWLNKL